MKRFWQVIPPTFSLVVLLFLLGGCASTTLPRLGIPSEVFELAAGNQAAVTLNVVLTGDESPSPGKSRVGHQYLLVAIPFGSVHLPSPGETVSNSMYQRLALRGLKPITSSGHVFGPLPHLDIEISEISISAFDLIFTRKVTASLKGQARLFAAGGAPLWEMPFEGSSSELRRYGFSAELEHALNDALDSALNPIAEGTAAALKLGH